MCFSTLDLLTGYWKVLLSQDAQEKAVFFTQRRIIELEGTTIFAHFRSRDLREVHGKCYKRLAMELTPALSRRCDIPLLDFHSHLAYLDEVLEQV